jgi:hypothetical protein
MDVIVAAAVALAGSIGDEGPVGSYDGDAPAGGGQ